MITINSDVRDFLQVFMAFGLAAILEQELGERVRLWWDSDGRVNINCGEATLSDAARAVKEHAERAVKSTWIGARSKIEDKSRATLSPRVGRFSDDDTYRRLQDERWAAIDSIQTSDQVDAALVGALGEPAYWYIGKAPTNPDAGASAWEMKTRNRGQEFVGDRLSLLVDVVAERDWVQIESGLSGRSTIDELGKGSLDSRTPTGLRAPGPTDSAVAWCALLGLGITGVRPIAPSASNTRPRSITHGALRTEAARSPDRPITWLYAPIPTHPTTLARLKAVYRSVALAGFVEQQVTAAGLAKSDSGVERHNLCGEWLYGKGVGVVTIARKYYSDNPNAPESWAIPVLVASTTEHG